jgi:hypothetical protein
VLPKRHANAIPSKLNRNLKSLMKPPNQRKLIPARHIDRTDSPSGRIDRPRTRNPDSADLVAVDCFCRGFDHCVVSVFEVVQWGQARDVSQNFALVVNDAC